MKKIYKNTGITLIALVITIVILLVLAGITISTLVGENGLILRGQKAKQAYTKAEMKEQLTVALQNLQTEQEGNATLEDVTQEWIDAEIQDCECTIKEDASTNNKKITMKKNGIEYKFLIDESLNIIEIEESNSSIELEYETKSKDEEDNIAILVIISDKEKGLDRIEFPDGEIIYCNGQKEVAKDYTVKLGENYIVKITSISGEEKEETIQINDYYYKIIKKLGEGINIDNAAIKAAYNKPYHATITTQDGDIIESLTVTMGGEAVTVDKTTGIIDIERVTGDIIIKATLRRTYLELNGSTYISTNLLQSDFMGAGKEFTMAIQVNINREKQSRIQYMDILGNHYYNSGIVFQFSGYTTDLLVSRIGSIDYTPYYDEWTDIVITSKDGINKMYVNNKLLLQSNDQYSPYGGFMIGNGYSDISRSMAGKISSFKLWSQELSAEEIEQLDLLEENTTIENSKIITEVIFDGIESVNQIGTFVGTGYSFNTTN